MSELLHTFRRKNLREKAATLVVTLLVLTLLSTIVVAFVQTVSMERSAARSVANRYQAELAADAGIQIFAASVPQAVLTNMSYFIISTNVGPSLSPITLLAMQYPPAASNSLPLLSGPLTNFLSNRVANSNALTDYLAIAANSSATNAADLNKTQGGLYRIIEQTNTDRFNAPWIYFTNQSGATNSRAAFFVIDEQSKLNLAYHGTSTNTNRAGWASDPTKVPISAPGIPNLPQPSLASEFALSTNKNVYANNLGNLFASRSDYENSKHLVTFFSGSNAQFIPPGYTNTNGLFVRYTNANLPKFNINDRATNTTFGATPAIRASNIANIINTNLPSFRTRDVSMAHGASGDPFRYLHRIASSIVDYIDSDSASTTLTDGSPEGEPAGKELAPLITTVAEKYNWVGESGSGTTWTNTILHTVFVQLWNPYQTNISGNFSFDLISARPVIMPGAPQTNMVTVQGSTNVTIRPNEHIVVRTGIATNRIFPVTIQASLNVANHPQMEQTSSTNTSSPRHTQFKAYWDGATLDRTPYQSVFIPPSGDQIAPGLSKSSVGSSDATRIILNGTNRFSINYPSHGSYTNIKGYRGSADPRQNYLTSYNWEDAASTNNGVRWFGRNNFTTDGSSPDKRSQDYSSLWSQRDFVRTNPVVGTFINLNSNDPTNAISPYNETLHASNAPFFIRNAPMQGIAELGNIFDPASLNDVGFATRAGSPQSWYASGGARTLRIGIPEFEYPNTNASPSGNERLAPEWNASGRRSIHLLDLFTVANTNSLGIPEVPARININTASREVLAAALTGLSQNADLAYTNSRLTANASLTVADTIISNRPYLNKSDFHKFTAALLNPTNYSPNLGTSGVTNIAAINPPGREQIFAGIVDLFDTKSQIFKVYSIGQTLGVNNQVLSEAIVESLIRFDIVNIGGQFRMVPVVLSRRNL
jgi:hypothetical protein